MIDEEQVAIEEAKNKLGINSDQIVQMIKAQKLAEAQLRKERAEIRTKNNTEKILILSSTPLNSDILPMEFEEYFEPMLYEIRYSNPRHGKKINIFYKLKESIDMNTYIGKDIKFGPFQFEVDYNKSVQMMLPNRSVVVSVIRDNTLKDKVTYVEASHTGMQASSIGSPKDALCAVAFLKDRQDIIKRLITEEVMELFELKVGNIDNTGYQDTLREMINIVEVENINLANRHILLVGPPGTGKSMLVKQLVVNTPHWLHYNITSDATNWVTSLEFINNVAKYIGKKVMIIIDEIDEIGLNRSISRTAVYQLMRAMDGVADLTSIKFVATTNRPGDLDAALLRVGRFGPVIPVDLPTVDQQEEIIKYYADKYNARVDVTMIRQYTENATGCDIRAAFENCIIQREEISTENVIKHSKILIGAKQYNTAIYS